MLVYGDPTFEATFQQLRERLCALVEQACGNPNDRDQLRRLLIVCGQVEQAAHDGLAPILPPGEAQHLVTTLHQATACAAEAFYGLAYRQPVALPAATVGPLTALHHLHQIMYYLAQFPDGKLSIKLPEAFSFHAVYPEQYCLAAGQWLAEHRADQTQGATVVGIRSIGTTLAAVVSTVLRAAGWQVRSFTVRPTGHPYQRMVDLREIAVEPGSFGLIVDEGPGISGSSMAATAAALVRAGVARTKIAFFPGHANQPGGAGTEEVRAWWQTTPRYVADSASIAFDGLPLASALAATLSEPVIAIEDFSGGLWRRFLYSDTSEWPAVCTAFERVKYRYILRSGKWVLFKFLGLGALSSDLVSTADAAATLLTARAAEGLGPPVVGAAYGFVATEWVEGAPLTLEAGTQAMVDVLGAYIARVAGPPLSNAEMEPATQRLAEMLYWNTHEALGEAAAQRTRDYQITAGCPHATYGDGHLQPYEWIRSQDGPVLKVDGVGHDGDHTLIGRQPVVWDLAGAIEEWNLDRPAIERLLVAFMATGGPTVDSDTLAFYRLAYLAFRMGECAMAAGVHDVYEHDRVQSAFEAYKMKLAQLLGALH